MNGIELWQGGDVRSRNIGPAVGDHFLGRVEGPGLYFFLASNTGGKSHHLRLISKIQKQRLLRSDADITDGQNVAFLELGATKISFRRLPTGEIAEPVREGLERLPQIEELPSPIETLITGNNLKGAEPRARARLEALLTYAPILSTEDLVRELCKVLDDRSFSADPGPEKRSLWTTLADRAKGERKIKVEPFRSAEEFLAFLLAAPREGILDDHGRLVDVLNATANTAEKVAEQQARVVAVAAGRIQEAVSAAARRLGVEDDGQILSRLRERVERPAPSPETLSSARVRLAELQADRRRQAQEEDRRRGLRDKHGARPNVEPAKALYGSAKAEHARLTTDLAAARARVRTAEEDLAARTEETAPLRAAIATKRSLWDGAVTLFNVALDNDRPVAEVEERAESARRSFEDLLGAVSASASAIDRRTTAAAALEVARDSAEDLEGKVEAARKAMLAREAELDGMKEVATSWEATEALLATPVPGPTDQEIEGAAAAVREAEVDAELWTAAGDYQRAAAAHDQEEEVFRWFDGIAADLREAAKESWTHLGQIVTEQLSLPWLMVAGLRMLLVYNGKGSNARLASSPEETVDVRDVDDPDRISTAELHEAMLRVMLSRRERLGGILIVPWQVMAALDERRLGTFSGWAKKAGLVVFSERPRRKGDPADLVLEFIPPVDDEGVAA